MAKTLIRNATQSPVALPLPYSGILAAGDGVIVDEPTSEVVSAIFGNDRALLNTYTVTQVSDRDSSGRSSRRETARKIGMALAQSAQDLEFNNVRLRRVGAPVVSTDAATRGYVDGEVDLLEAQIAAIPRWFYAERYFELGNAATGIWYVTVTGRASTPTAFDALAATKHASSVAGPLGSFVVSLENPSSVAVQSVTLFTYTRRETQPKVVLVMNNPQGARPAHRFVRPSVVQFPPTNAQQTTPTVSVAGADGLVPSTYGVTGQLDPNASYPKIRVVATGFFAAETNAVSDARFNKPQSLVVQF